jgi:hypothetical protein
MPSKWNPDSGRTSGKSNPRRAMGQANAYGQQRRMQGNLNPMVRPQPAGMTSIQPPGGPMGPMGPPPMGPTGGQDDAMRRMAVLRAGGGMDKPDMAGPPPMPQFQRPDMSQFQRGGIGAPPGPIGPPPGAIPPITGGPMPAPPGGGGGFVRPRPMPTYPQMPQRPMMPNPGMGSIGPPPPMGGGDPRANLDMGMQQRRMAMLAGAGRPGMM